MSFVPFATIWVVLVAAAGVCLLASDRPRILIAVTFLAPLSAIAIWFFYRPDAVIPVFSIAGRQWAIGETAWQLTGMSLLLGLTAAALSITNHERLQSNRHSALSFGLTAASLSAVWAADDRTRVMGVALFALAWAAALLLNRQPEGSHTIDGARHAFRLFVALFPLWLAAAWPAARLPLSLLAGAILLGVWPFGGWRLPSRGDPLALLLGGLPVIVGAAVLATAMSSTIPAPAAVGVATAFGMLSLIAGMTHAWENSPQQLAGALGLGLAGLALTAGIWAGQEALVAAARLAVFVPVMVQIGLAPQGQPPLPFGEGAATGRLRISPAHIALILAFLAMAGLPLTVGFNALAPLYETWRLSSGWVLMLAFMLLLSMWLAAVYLTGRATKHTASAERVEWLGGAVLVFPALGLIHLDIAALDVAALIWAAIIIPPTAAILLGRFMPNLDGLGGLLREAITIPQPAERISLQIGLAGRLVVEALNDALAILEGEFGLLWLLGLLLLLLWIA